MHPASSALPIQMGIPHTTAAPLAHLARAALCAYINRSHTRVYLGTDSSAPSRAIYLAKKTVFYKYFLLDGRRITPTTVSLTTSASSALVKAVVDEKMCVGEVLAVFRHVQPEINEDNTYVEVRWMIREALSPVDADPWAQ